MTYLIYAVRIYSWIAMIGFPIALPWALLKRRDMEDNYYIGFENGQHSMEVDNE